MEILGAETVAESINKLVSNAKAKYGSSRIHASLLLPRKDSAQAEVQKTNRLITASIQQTLPGVRIIQHPTIGEKHLRDAKHLERYVLDNSAHSGTQLFSKDLYRSVVGQDPTDEILRHSRRWNSKPNRNARYSNYSDNNGY